MTTTAGPAAPTDEVRDLVARRVPGHTLEAPFYTSEAVYEADLSAVWSRTWLFVAHEAEVREPGDFVTVDVGPSSVIVLRDDDGVVRGLRNVCRHRGARVLTEREGSVGNLVCGYHRWTYAVDGSLLHAGDQAPDFDKGCWSLRQVHVRLVAGLVFVCLAADPPDDVDDLVATVSPYLLPHALHRTKVAAQVDLVEEANWKLVMENNRECYHCEGSHPELTCTFFPTWGIAPDRVPPRLRVAHERYLAAEAALERTCDERGLPYAEVEALEAERRTAFRVQREALDGAGESYTTDGSLAVRRLLGDLDVPRLGRASVHTQPNGWYHALSDHVVTFSVLPLGPTRTLVRTTWLVHEDAVEGEDYDVDALTLVWRVTNEQDSALVARAQAGVTDPGYVPGPYAPSERQVETFTAWYVARMQEHLAP
ncbi:aromatic ring-hydroxylating oxygenase subunit alpha [Phycicoccus flavus]|uniref:aromatic ring-hydroxylating oxygenase subunit alpha n=1 Tax=Phycicoccus flavus TaxID=2502783 RepID=UPI000FEBFA7A|nr:aromatic ring-hydroxylating dioxygenase subunit alpha [Phycicoccus flavus]NHA66479.1 aromatic ring-hydroxylating dioxygenase subunit alpha [Phycicoccus flavus]